MRERERIVNNWNRLPNEIVNAESLNEFKNKFDEFNKDIMFSTDIDYYAKSLPIQLTQFFILFLPTIILL